MSSLTFRNLSVTPDDPIEQWGVEGSADPVERGRIEDWRRVARAVRNDPHGTVAADLAAALRVAEPSGVTAVMAQVFASAHAGSMAQVAGRVPRAIRRSGLTAAVFASRVGTSASRLSTYANGTVVPAAALLVRIERAGRQSFA